MVVFVDFWQLIIVHFGIKNFPRIKLFQRKYWMTSSIKFETRVLLFHWIIFSLDHFKRIVSYITFSIEPKSSVLFIFTGGKRTTTSDIYSLTKKKKRENVKKFRNDCQFKKEEKIYEFNNQNSARLTVRTSSKQFETICTNISRHSCRISRNVYIECRYVRDVTCYNKLCVSVCIGIETEKKKKKKSVRGNHKWNGITVSHS